MQFCARLADLLEVGFPLHAGLDYLRVSLPKADATWTAMQARLAAGDALEQVVAGAHFNPVIASQIQLASVHGQLPAALRAAAQFLTLQQQNRGKLAQLLVYPAALVTLLMGLQLFLLVGVLPTVGGTGAAVWPQLIAWGIAGVVIALGWVGWKRLTSTQRFWILRHVPGARAVSVTYYQFQLVSGAAAFLAAGQAMPAYFAALRQLPDGVLADVANAIVTRMADGAAFETALAHPLVYPPARELLRLGQTPAFVATGMGLLATQLMARLQTQLTRALGLVQPILFALIATQIILMYRALLLPLYGGGGFP